MKSVWILCSFALAACATAQKTEHRTVIIYDNELVFDSGTFKKQRFAFVALTERNKTWKGRFEGGKKKWRDRHDFLRFCVRKEAERICDSPFYATTKQPIYNMLDGDETLGGVAPVLGIAASMLAYLATEAATKDTNVPASVYMEFSCMSDEE